MEIITRLENIKCPALTVTVGTFDGLHKGHLHLLDQLRKKAAELNTQSAVLTFWPHPRYVLQKDIQSLRLLNTLDEKIKLLEESGIDCLIIQPFTQEFSSLTADEFVAKILVEKLHARWLIVGFNHQFGRNREGNFENLKKISDPFGIGLSKVEPLDAGDLPVSSTRIRNLIETGRIVEANELLGYRYMVSGKVTKGNQLGRLIGFPTANVLISEAFKVIPAMGVYAAFFEYKHQVYPCMVNIGVRPTVNPLGDQPATIEANIFDFDQDIYGSDVRIWFVKKLRDEQKFENIDALNAQLNKDKKHAETCLSVL